jgi:transposase
VGAAAMIPLSSGVRVWIATGHTDMRRGMNSLALLVQEALRRDPHGGDLYVFRGRSGKLIKILWHDGLGMSLYAKRLERGKFIWPPARCRSRRRRWPTCSKGSTGGIPNRAGGR